MTCLIFEWVMGRQCDYWAIGNNSMVMMVDASFSFFLYLRFRWFWEFFKVGIAEKIGELSLGQNFQVAVDSNQQFYGTLVLTCV